MGDITAESTDTAKGILGIPNGNQIFPSVGVWKHVVVSLVLAAVVLLSYGNTLHDTGFALDNEEVIKGDPRLRAVTPENIRLIFTQDYWFSTGIQIGLYRPLTTMSYLLNYSVFGNAEAAAGYHWVNVGLHWIAALLVYLLGLMLLRQVGPAFFVAALYATHPVATEAVTNIVGRADLLMTVTVLAGFLCYVKSTTVRGWRKVAWLSALSTLTLIGVLCKENAVVVLGVMGLYDLTYRMERLDTGTFRNLLKNGWRFFWQGYVAFVPPFVALWLARSMVFSKLPLQEIQFPENPLIDLDFWTARLTAIKIVGKYLWLLVWPAHLSCDYSYNQIPLVTGRFNTWEDWKALVVLVSVAVILTVGVLSIRRKPPVFFFIFFFFGTFLPTSNLFPKLGYPLFQKESWVIGTIMAERFMCLPMIGFVGCAVIFVYSVFEWALPRMRRYGWSSSLLPRNAAMVVLSLIMAAYGIRTMFRNPDWENDITLWTAALEVCPDSYRPHAALAAVLLENDPQMLYLDRAIEEGRRAIQITDQAKDVFHNLGAHYRIKGDSVALRNPDGSLLVTPESKFWYRQSVDVLNHAVKLDHAFNVENRKKELDWGRKPEEIPDVGLWPIYVNLSYTLRRLGRLGEAKQALLYGRHLSPANPKLLSALASHYLAEGDYKSAVVSLVEVALIDGSWTKNVSMLVDIYRQIDPKGDSTIAFPSEPKARINPNSALVRKDIRAAYIDLVNELRAARQFELANQFVIQAFERGVSQRE